MYGAASHITDTEFSLSAGGPRAATEITAFSAEAPLPRAVQEARFAVWKLKNPFTQGTGFAISPRRMITNFHVIQGLLLEGKLADISLSQDTPPDRASPPLPKRLKIQRILRLSASLDLALLEVNQDMPRYLSLRGDPPHPAEELFAPGYPQGSFFNVRKTAPSKKFFDLKIFSVNHPNLIGGSGSPLLDTRGQVTGVLFTDSYYFLSSSSLAQLKNFVERRKGIRCLPSEPARKCFSHAFVSLHEKAEQGSAVSQYRLGAMHIEGLLAEKSNAQQAILWLRRAAEQGLPIAQQLLSEMYLFGDVVEKDLFQAAHWARLAAEQGYAPSQYNLGSLYYRGEGVEQDFKKAIEWFRLAAEQGDPLAQSRLGVMYYKGKEAEQNFEEAAYWFRLAAERGHALSQYNLGSMYYKGEGVEQNFKLALYWLSLAAEQKARSAYYVLGIIYYRGKGVEQNFEEAARWFRLAAERGHTLSQYNLGSMYYNGEGVEQDFKLALYWLSLAASKGMQKDFILLKKTLEKDQ